MIDATGDLAAALLLSVTAGFVAANVVADTTMRDGPAWLAFLLTAGIVGWRFLAALNWW